MSRTRRVTVLLGTLLLALTLGLGGCTPAANEPKSPTEPAQAPTETPEANPIAIRIGALTTEDILPLWVAEMNAYFGEVGLPEVEMWTFPSAQESNAALAAGEIDAIMGDVMNAAALTASGTEMNLAFVTLGADASQGRFGVVLKPGFEIADVKDLAGIPVGIGSNTILEYMYDKTMENHGVAIDDLKKEEIKKIPVRFEMVMSGQVDAAALPNSFIEFALKQGATLAIDDTEGENLTQSVFMVREKYLEQKGAAETMALVEEAWNKGVDAIAADPEAYRELLAEKARLPEPVAAGYPIATYPKAARPEATMVLSQLEWMDIHGYLTAPLGYDAATGSFTKK